MKSIKPVKTIRLLIVGILIGAVLLGGGYFLGKRVGDGDKKEELSAITLQNQILSMSELAVATYTYTELGQYESSREFYGVKMPFTTNKFILTYDGVIKAGIDMAKVTVKVDEDTKVVTVSLPEPEILSHEIDEDSVKIFDEKTSIFNIFSIEDYTRFYADQKKAVEKKAEAKGLLTGAKDQAEKAIRQMLEPVLAAAGGDGGDDGDDGDDGDGSSADGQWTLRFA